MGDVLVVVAVSNRQCSVCIKGSCTSFMKEALPVRRRETGHGSQEWGHLVQKEPGSRSSLVGTPGEDVGSRFCVFVESLRNLVCGSEWIFPRHVLNVKHKTPGQGLNAHRHSNHDVDVLERANGGNTCLLGCVDLCWSCILRTWKLAHWVSPGKSQTWK